MLGLMLLVWGGSWLNASRIAFFAVFNPLRPGAEKVIAPLIKEARIFLNRLGETVAYENVVKTLDEGKNVAKKLLSKDPDVFCGVRHWWN